jgi:iron(III) transport system ATP-binding protein
MVTHDQEEALAMADRIIVMSNAVVEQIGRPHAVYNRPATRFVANFVGTMNFYGKEKRGIRPEKIKIVDYSQPYDIVAMVQELEFKGAITRVHSFVPEENTELCIDLPSEYADSMNLKPEAALFLQFPEYSAEPWSGEEREPLFVTPPADHSLKYAYGNP